VVQDEGEVIPRIKTVSSTSVKKQEKIASPMLQLSVALSLLLTGQGRLWQGGDAL
jgi:hypothetical protein